MRASPRSDKFGAMLALGADLASTGQWCADEANPAAAAATGALCDHK